MSDPTTGALPPWPPDELASDLTAAAAHWGEREAIQCGDRRLTYAEVGEGVARLACAYRRLGVSRGERVVCQLPNSPEHLLAAGAAWASGIVHVGTDHDLTGEELAWIVARTEAAALLYAADPAADPAADAGEVLAQVRRASPGTRIVVAGPGPTLPAGALALEELLAQPPEAGWTPTPAARDETSHLWLTSGTTGRPKGVMESLAGCWAKMQFFADAFGPGPADTWLVYLPIAHVFGMRLAMIALLTGGRLVLVPRFSPRGALELVGREGVTVLPGMPAHFQLLLRTLDPGRHRLTSLRWGISAASTMPRPLARRIYDDLGVELLYVYGCSENFTVQTTDRGEVLGGSVGRWVYRGPEGTPPNGQVAILEPGGGTTPLATGVVGEIAFGASHPVHYWKAPDAATDGWYRTGDLGRLDGDGRLYVVGRLKELINRGGLHVSPSEIESVVARHPGVADAAVVATPDDVIGEAICACVVPRGPGVAPVTIDELRTFLGASLARHKLPDELCLVEGIPRTKIGKVDRASLGAAATARPRQRWRRGSTVRTGPEPGTGAGAGAGEGEVGGGGAGP